MPSHELTDAKLSVREKISYGLGEAATNLSWAMMTSFLLFFYTNVALLPVTALGTLFLCSRILDAFADPAIGAIVDRTRSKYGKARVYLLYGCIPFAALSILTFVSPEISTIGRIIYAYITFIALGLGFSAIGIPYSALMPMMTLDTNERMQLGSLRVIGSQAGTIVVTSLTLPLVALLGGSNQKLGFVLTIAVMSALATILYLIVFSNCRERYSIQLAKRASAISEVRDMFLNRAWFVTFVFMIFEFIRLGIMPAVTVFYALNVLKMPWVVSLLLPLMAVGFLSGAIIAPPLFKWLGKRMGNIVTMMAAIALYGIMAMLQNQIYAFLVAYTFAMLALGLQIHRCMR